MLIHKPIFKLQHGPLIRMVRSIDIMNGNDHRYQIHSSITNHDHHQRSSTFTSQWHKSWQMATSVTTRPWRRHHTSFPTTTTNNTQQDTAESGSNLAQKSIRAKTLRRQCELQANEGRYHHHPNRYLSSFSCSHRPSQPRLVFQHKINKHFSLNDQILSSHLRHFSTEPIDMDQQSNMDQNKPSQSNQDQLPDLSEFGHLTPSLSLDNGNTIKRSPSSSSKKVCRIIVEGNIGSGKTTFLKIFSKSSASLLHPPLIIPEPINLWRNVGGVNIFQLLADDPKRWSFTFQSYVQLTMVKIHEMEPEESNFKVMERSLYSARYCFVENLKRNGILDDAECFILDQWFEASLPSAPVDLIIYLRSDPNIVYKRIQERGRPEESGIKLEYLQTLHELHEEWLIEKKFPLPAPVLTIDANIPFEKIVSVYEQKTGGILRDISF